MEKVKGRLTKAFSVFLAVLMIMAMLPGGLLKASADTSYYETARTPIEIKAKAEAYLGVKYSSYVQSNAYGFRNFKRFRNRILHIFNNQHTKKMATA